MTPELEKLWRDSKSTKDSYYYIAKVWYRPVHLICGVKVRHEEVFESKDHYDASPYCWEEVEKLIPRYAEESHNTRRKRERSEQDKRAKML